MSKVHVSQGTLNMGSSKDANCSPSKFLSHYQRFQINQFSSPVKYPEYSSKTKRELKASFTLE